MIETKKVSDYLTEFRFIGGLGSKQKWLLISDIHYDSTYCDRKLLKKHLDEAVESGSKIFINGDWFDVMGCYKDPRSKPQDIRPEYYAKRPYLDLILEDSYKFLKKYADNIAFIGYGNHETAIIKHRDTDIMERLHHLLSQHNENIVLGAYDGFVKFVFTSKDGGQVRTKLMHYHHGTGGNAFRSKGVLRNQIDGFIYPQADIIIRGHDHMKLYDPSNVRVLISQSGELKTSSQHIIKTGSYKDGSKKQFGWEKEKGFLPTKMGGWFMDLTYKQDGVVIDVMEAQ